MSKPQDSDEWLMAEVAQGRRGPLDNLVRRHATPLLTFIRRMVGDAHRSEELFQEVFLTVWCKRHLYDFPRSFRAWLYRIAVNKCRAFFRVRKLPTIALGHEDLAAPSRGSDSSPLETAIAAETAHQVSAAVTRLPTQQRLVVVLRIWQGLSYAEIADLLGRSEATVRSHMHHALAALRHDLEPVL